MDQEKARRLKYLLDQSKATGKLQTSTIPQNPEIDSLWGDSQFQYNAPPQLGPQVPPKQDVNEYGIPPVNRYGIPVEGIQNMYKAMDRPVPPTASIHAAGGANPPGNSAQKLAMELLASRKSPELPEQAVQDDSDITPLPRAVRQPVQGFGDKLREFFGSSGTEEETRLGNLRDISEGLGNIYAPTPGEILLNQPRPEPMQATGIREKLQRIRNRRAFEAMGLPPEIGDATPSALPALAGIDKARSYGNMRQREQLIGQSRQFNQEMKDIKDSKKRLEQVKDLLLVGNSAATKGAIANYARGIGLAPLSDDDRREIATPMGILQRIENDLSRWTLDDLSPAYKKQMMQAIEANMATINKILDRGAQGYADQRASMFRMDPAEFKAFLLNSASEQGAPQQGGDTVTVYDPDDGEAHQIPRSKLQAALQQGALQSPPVR